MHRALRYATTAACCVVVLAIGGCDDTIVVPPPNAQPEITAIPDQDADESAAFYLDLATFVTDDRDDVADLTFYVTSGGGAFTGTVYGNTFSEPGTVTVAVLVRDTEGGASTAVFQVVVAATPNTAPTVGVVAAQTATTGYTLALDVALAAGVTDDNDAVADLTFAVVSGGGSFSGAVYINSFPAPGAVTVSFTVTDSDGAATPGTFDVTVADPPPTNLPPAVTTVPAQSTDEGLAFVLDLAAYVTDDHDATGTLTFAVTSGGGSFTGSSYGNTFGPPGPMLVEFIVTDSGSMSSTGSFSVMVNEVVANTAPVIEQIPSSSGGVNKKITIDLAPYVTDDRDADTELVFAVVTGSGMFSGSSYTAQFAVGGTSTETFTVTDTDGAQSTGSLKMITANATWYVDAKGGDDVSNSGTTAQDAFASIQKGLTTATAGDMVLVADGSYTGTENTELDFAGKAIVLKSTGGALACVIDCEGAARGFHFDDGETPDAVVDGFTVQNGSVSGADGGGMLLELASTPVVQNCRILGGQASGADGGGGIACLSGAHATFLDCTISHNTASNGGGVLVNDADPVFCRCSIVAGQAGDLGGGLYLTYSHAEVSGCSVLDNTADTSGGGVYIQWTAAPLIEDSIISGNEALSNGGGIICLGDATISGCDISSNTADQYGGGLYAETGSPTTTDCVFTGNMATAGGGAAVADSSPVFTRCTFSANRAAVAGGYYSGGQDSPILLNCTIVNNRATEGYNGYTYSAWAGGAGCIGYDCGDTFIGCLIANNEAIGTTSNTASGGGVYGTQGVDISLINCTVANNRVTGASALGGGIATEGNNTAGFTDDLSLRNTVIWGNAADTDGNQLHCGHDIDDISSITTDACIYANGAGDIGGYTSPVDALGTCAYADPSVSPNFPGFVDLGAAMQFGGGDFHLIAGSPCVDFGHNAYVPVQLTTDLDGEDREVDGNGSYETYNGTALSVDAGVYERQ